MWSLHQPIDNLPRLYQNLAKRYGTHEQCGERLQALAWPYGFRCRRCGFDRCHLIQTRDLQECARCKTQHSLTAGLPMHGTRTDLPRWFEFIYYLATGATKQELIEEAARMNLSERTARRWLRKLEGHRNRDAARFIDAFMLDLRRP